MLSHVLVPKGEETQENDLPAEGLEGCAEKRQRIMSSEGHEGAYKVYAQSKIKFHHSLYEQCPLVSDGKCTRGISYRMTLDGAQIISSEAPDAADYPYIDVTTLNTWIHDVSVAVVRAALFFVTAFSHATFISATFALSHQNMGMQLKLTWIMICVIGVDYCAQCILAWRQSTKLWKIEVGTGLVITDDDMSLAKVSSMQCWITFLCTTLLTLVNVPDKLRVAPIYFHPNKGIRMCSLNKIGGHRMTFVGFRTLWECEAENRPGQFHRTVLSFVTGTSLIVLKAMICFHQQSSCVFIIVNVGFPILMDTVKLFDIIKLYRIRQGFRRSLQRGLDSPDDTVRAMSRGMLEKHFDIRLLVPANEKQHLSRSARACEAVALELDAKLSDMQISFAMLERRRRLRPGETLQLVQAIRQHLQQACFPCFFELATPSSIHMTSYNFPHDWGPFALEAIDVKLSMDRPPAPPETGKSQPTPWTVSLDDFPPSRVALACGSGGAVHGMISPLSEVTVPEKQKAAMGIPVTAHWYAWSYPVATKGRLPDDIVECQKCMGETPEDALLLWGAYVYLNRDLEIVAVLAAKNKRAGGELTGLLGFRAPLPIHRDGPLAIALKEAIDTDGGFPVSALLNEGQYEGLRMLWLASRDIKTEKPSHGGFVFFFGNDLPEISRSSTACSIESQ